MGGREAALVPAYGKGATPPGGDRHRGASYEQGALGKGT